MVEHLLRPDFIAQALPPNDNSNKGCPKGPPVRTSGH